jgi:endonuclease III
MQRAHQLLRRHGQELCRNTAPACDRCPLASSCPRIGVAP